MDATSETPRIADRADEIDAFRQTTTPDIYRPDTFVDWPWVAANEQRLDSATHALQAVFQKDHGDIGALSRALRVPGATEVVALVYAAPSGAGFERQRELPEGPVESEKEATKLASLLADLGWWTYFPSHADISSALRSAIVARDARRRGFRRRDEFAARVRQLITDATAHVDAALPGSSVRVLPASEYPAFLRGRADGVVGVGEQSVAAISVVFETLSGGRQYRNLSDGLPALQRELDELPATLIVVADGRGVAGAPQHVLESLFASVGACMSFHQAEEGALAEALLEAVRRRGVRPHVGADLDAVIRRLMLEVGVVTLTDLPVDSGTASREMRRFAEGEAELALVYDADHDELRWRRAAEVASARELRLSFQPQKAKDLLGALLSAQAEVEQAEDELEHLRLPIDQVLPELLPVDAAADEVGAETVRQLARRARRVGDARLAVLLARDGDAWLRSPERLTVQRQMATSVVVVTPDDLLEMARLRSLPRDTFAKKVLTQADLSRNSPFVWTSVTPERIFRGRQGEIDFVRDAVMTNSVALVGGRRIGKTSLMRRLEAILAEQDLSPFYLDCHPIGNWSSFSELAARGWGVTVTDVFSPEAVYDLIAALSERGRPVLILDEIDALLQWDLRSHGTHPREALFKSFRAASQEERAQFVFSGERVIAERLWDPSSPHWNFCRELKLRQLTPNATSALLLDPIRSLQIQILNVDAFETLVWRYTSGHPQLVQFLGDLLIQSMNERPADDRGSLTPEDLVVSADSATFRRQYLETYWGQATEEEKAISIEVAGGRLSFEDLLDQLPGRELGRDRLNHAIKILELYGIVDWQESEISLRAEWMAEALEVFGGTDAALKSLAATE